MSSEVGPRTLREEQRALTRRRLIEAAKVVFASKGYQGASVDAIARQAGATSGALYANFSGKEDLFLALFDEWIAQDVGDYDTAVTAQDTLEGQARAGADHWMSVLRERPSYFPLLIEFWSSAIREPLVRDRLAAHFVALRRGSGTVAARVAAPRGVRLDSETTERLGLFINALGNGLALEKLLDPDGVPDAFFGDLLTLIFEALLPPGGPNR